MRSTFIEYGKRPSDSIAETRGSELFTVVLDDVLPYDYRNIDEIMEFDFRSNAVVDCTTLEMMVAVFLWYNCMTIRMGEGHDGTDPIPFLIRYYVAVDQSVYQLTPDHVNELSLDLLWHVNSFLFGLRTVKSSRIVTTRSYKG